MKVLCIYKVNHTIEGKPSQGRVLVGLHTMNKDGNSYEFIKTYKLDKNCPELVTGSIGELLFNDRGKVAGFKPDK